MQRTHPNPYHSIRFLLLVLIVGSLGLLLIRSGYAMDYDRFIFRPPTQQESFLDKYVWKHFQQKLFDGSYAMIVAVGDYDHLSKLESVTYDAAKMKTFLLETAEYDEVVVLQDAEASFATIRYFMEEYFPQKMQKGRYRFLFYFSGHGAQREGYGGTIIGFLQLKGATREPTTQSINMHHIENWAIQLPRATHMLFLLDACFSGLAGTEDKSYETNVDPMELAEENGRFMMTAGGADETSIASLKRWGGSLFTDVVIYGMGGAADFDDDGVVTMYELFTYTQAAVRNEAQKARHNQHPLISNLGRYSDKGQYFFVYRDPSPPPLETIAVPADEEKKEGETRPTPEPSPLPTTPQTALPVIPPRSKPQTVSSVDALEVFGLGENWRPLEYIQNEYEDQGEVVVDHATGLMWQKSGSPKGLIYADAQKYVGGLNRQKFAGYDDWRLPTIPELMSLLEPEKQSNGLYIDSRFDKPEEYPWYWSADRLPESEGDSSGAAWSVHFLSGNMYWNYLNYEVYVRCVRSRQ